MGPQVDASGGPLCLVCRGPAAPSAESAPPHRRPAADAGTEALAEASEAKADPAAAAVASSLPAETAGSALELAGADVAAGAAEQLWLLQR